MSRWTPPSQGQEAAEEEGEAEDLFFLFSTAGVPSCGCAKAPGLTSGSRCSCQSTWSSGTGASCAGTGSGGGKSAQHPSQPCDRGSPALPRGKLCSMCFSFHLQDAQSHPSQMKKGLIYKGQGQTRAESQLSPMSLLIACIKCQGCILIPQITEVSQNYLLLWNCDPPAPAWLVLPCLCQITLSVSEIPSCPS